MPADVTLPSVDDYLSAYNGGVTAKRDEADTHRGSRYEVWGGVGAVLFNRITARARGNFRNNYFDTSDESSLDTIVSQRYPTITARTLTTKGVGTITFERPNDSAGPGDIFEGTRVRIGQRFYVTTQTKHLTTDLSVVVDAEAEVAGAGQAVDASASNGDVLVLEDAVFDQTLRVARIVIADGTDEETATQFRSRVRVTRFDKRVGYVKFISDSMKEAGASQVVLFASDYFGDAFDHGLNRIYVGDDSLTASAALLQACRLKAFECVTCGMAPQILPLRGQSLQVTLTVTLWDPLVGTARDALESNIRSRALNYIDANPYVWNLDALLGAARGASQDISDIEASASADPPDIATLFDTPPLTRWSLSANDLIVVFK